MVLEVLSFYHRCCFVFQICFCEKPSSQDQKNNFNNFLVVKICCDRLPSKRNMKKEEFMLAHSLRDSVHHGSEGMVQSLGQLIPLCLQPGSRQVDADAQLASSFLSVFVLGLRP